jgi:hypothetical protein
VETPLRLCALGAVAELQRKAATALETGSIAHSPKQKDPTFYSQVFCHFKLILEERKV